MDQESESSDEPRVRIGRPYIGMHFKCCNVYARIYLNADGSAYAGGCPSCGGWVCVRVGPDGTEDRFFQAR